VAIMAWTKRRRRVGVRMIWSTRVAVGTGRQADETVKSGGVRAADGRVGRVALAADAEMSIAVRDGLTARGSDRLLLSFGIRVLRRGRRTRTACGARQWLGSQPRAAVGTSGNVDAGELAEKGAPIGNDGLVGNDRFGLCVVALGSLPLDSGAGGGELGIDATCGVEAEVPDLDEAAGKDVEEKSAHEFHGRKLAGLLVAGSKDDVLVVDAKDAMIGDGDPVGIEAEVAKERV
jgi:hypothetical protein